MKVNFYKCYFEKNGVRISKEKTSPTKSPSQLKMELLEQYSPDKGYKFTSGTGGAKNI